MIDLSYEFQALPWPISRIRRRYEAKLIASVFYLVLSLPTHATLNTIRLIDDYQSR